MVVVEGGLIYLDQPVNGAVAACEDGFTVLECTRKYCREPGLDVRQLDKLIRLSRVAESCLAAQLTGCVVGGQCASASTEEEP